MAATRDFKIIVPIKQVPDMDSVEFDYEEGRVDRSSAELEPNPFDLNALEEAVRAKEELGGEVIALSMGPKQAESTLREALARGADRGILLSDKAFAGSDTWATAKALALATEKLAPFDLIICGEKTVDGDTGQVGPEMAESLGVPHVPFVSEVLARSKEWFDLEGTVWDKRYVKRVRPPFLFAVTKDVNEPRLPAFKDKMRARKEEIEIWEAADIAEDVEGFGINGSPTFVKGVEVPPPQEREGIIFEQEPGEAVDKLFEALTREGIL